MFRLIFFLVLGSLYFQSVAQETFSRRFHFGFPAAVFTGLEILGDTFAVSGIVVDSIFPYKQGSVLCLFDSIGNPMNSRATVFSDKKYTTWANVLTYFDGSLYTVGSVVDPITKGLLVKYSLDGEIEWERILSSFIAPDAFFRFHDLLVLEHNLYVTGVNIVHENQPYEGQVILVKYNMEGEVQLTQSYGEPGWTDQAECVVKLNENIIVIGGVREKIYMQSQNFDYQTQLIAVDTMGEVLWQWRSPEDQLQQGAQSMVATPDGGLIVASAIGTEEFINAESTYIAWDCYIFKLNSDLEEEWGTIVADGIPNPLHKLMKVIPVSDGSGYLAVGIQGVTYSYGDINEENTADIGGYLVKVSPEGEKLWSRVIIHPDLPTFIEYHEIYDVAETPDGGFLAVGRSADFSGTEEVPSQGWLLKVDEYGCLVPGCHLVSAAEEVDNAQPKLLLYPNPVKDILNVYLGPGTIPERSLLRIIDVQGKVWQQRRAEWADATYMLDVDELPAGPYFLQLTDESGRVLGVTQFVKL